MTTQEKFERYHLDNPHVYENLKALALQVKRAGHDTYSIDSITERVRWHYAFDVKTSDPFKLSNNYRPYYARLLMKQEPELVGFFRIHRCAADVQEAA